MGNIDPKEFYEKLRTNWIRETGKCCMWSWGDITRILETVDQCDREENSTIEDLEEQIEELREELRVAEQDCLDAVETNHVLRSNLQSLKKRNTDVR